MGLCSAKNCSSFSFLLALFIYFFILVCLILFQLCLLVAMTAKDFEKMLDRKLQALVTSLDTLTKSVDFMSTKYDKLLQKVMVLEQANAKQSKKNKELEESNTKLNAEVANLSEKLKVCKESLNDNLEQYTRRECLEVSGIPELQDENTDELVIKVGSESSNTKAKF